MIGGTIEWSNITGSLPTDLPISLSPAEQPFSINTTTWTSPNSSPTSIIIPADLEAGDSVPGDGTAQNLTAWNGRTAVLINGWNGTAVLINASESMGLLGSAEFDDQTGVFLEASGSTIYRYYAITYSIKLTDTSLFSTALALLGVAWWIWAVAIAVILGVILGVIVPKRRRRQSTVKSSATPPPPPSPTSA
jgi:hypothetical protein